MQQRITINLNIDSKTTDKTTILEYCRSHGIAGIETPCGGKGTCGKCKVTVTKPYYKDVLACRTRICDGMEIIVGRKESTGTKEDSMVVLTNGGNVSEKFNEHVNRNVVLKEETVNESEKVESNAGTLAACDIGTTTVVCYLIDKETGQIISTRSSANPQRSFGADVLSRIEAAGRIEASSEPGLKIMQTQIVSLLNGFISEMLTECGRTKVSRFSVAGNTVMCHLLMGISPEKLGKAPFMPDEYFGREFNPLDIGIENCQTMIIFPAVSGFVGGDITAGMMETVNRNELTLYLDIGTNGEMALGNKARMTACSTAAGPALEGAKIKFGMRGAPGAIDHVWVEDGKIQCSVIGSGVAKGICGSGLIDAVASLLELGLLNARGRLLTDEEVDGERIARLTDTVYITQNDIREVQMAKGAIAAGISLMARELGLEISQIDKVLLAGAFGSFLKPESACRIGLLPAELLEKITAVGNAAGSGAKMMVCSKDEFTRTDELISHIEFIELANLPDFQHEFAKNMRF